VSEFIYRDMLPRQIGTDNTGIQNVTWIISSVSSSVSSGHNSNDGSRSNSLHVYCVIQYLPIHSVSWFDDVYHKNSLVVIFTYK